MEAIQIESSVTLSRAAAGAIPQGVAVERYLAGQARVYGGEKISDMQTLWETPETTVVESLVTAVFDIYGGTTPYMNRFTETSCTTGQVIAYLDWAEPVDMSKDTYYYILMKSSVIIAAAGLLQCGTAEIAAMSGAAYDNVPATSIADTWYYHRVPITSSAAARSDVICFGFKNVGGTRSDVLDVQYVGRGGCAYGMLGFSTNDEIAIHGNEADADYKEYDDVKIIAAGHINPYLIKGKTAVGGQRLYVVPGGKLSTVAIVDGNRTIIATEDQTTAGGQVGVLL